jgi:hypothetical protein
MAQLGDLLELLHDAHIRLTTFEIEYRDWRRQRPSNEVALVDDGGGKPRLGWRGAGPWPAEIVTTRRVWLERPEHLRVEILEDEMLIRYGIRAGPQWWRWDAVLGTTSGSLAPEGGGIASLPPLLLPPVLATHELMANVRFEPSGRGERAGRQVLCARAQARRPPHLRGMLAYELEFDAEHGTLLRRAEFEDGELVWEREAREVQYGCQFDPQCFVFVAPEDELSNETDPTSS